MYILELNQNGEATELALFDAIEEGREFIKQTNCYEITEEDGFVYEYIDPEKLGDYVELEYNGNIIPLTKFMFTEEGKVEIFWKEIPNLSEKGNGLVDNSTRVDAYVIANKDVKTYIEAREKSYYEVKKYLEEKGYEVDRAYFGSEDGEAIVYRKNEKDEWQFLTHMDPSFFEDKTQQEIIDEIEEDLN
ncbi:MAG: hypothetical protein E7H28_07105 [Finegoldia magna]|nr:hypothetical protein [Finegoldia magna]